MKYGLPNMMSAQQYMNYLRMISMNQNPLFRNLPTSTSASAAAAAGMDI